MAWIYLAELVGSELPLVLGCEQSRIVSATDTLKAYYCPECDQVTLIQRLSGMTSQHCAEKCFHESRSYRGDFLARTSVLPGLEKAWKVSEAVFSSKSSDSPENANQDLFSSKTFLPSEPVEGKEWLKNWPRSGMTVGGQLFQPPQLEPPTSGKDGFFWPTPRASEYKDCGPVGSKSQIHMEKRDYLCAKVKDPLNPTGQLNPHWVEWLMGYQIGHTELDASVIPWFRFKSGRRSKNSQGLTDGN